MTHPSDIPAEIYEWAEIFCDANIETDDRELVARAFMAGQGAPKQPTAKPASGMTARQRDALSFVGRFIDEHSGMSPAVREVADELGLTLSRAHAILKQLERRGIVAMVPRCARSITIVARA